jgi:hypothetical protein
MAFIFIQNCHSYTQRGLTKSQLAQTRQYKIKPEFGTTYIFPILESIPCNLTKKTIKINTTTIVK